MLNGSLGAVDQQTQQPFGTPGRGNVPNSPLLQALGAGPGAATGGLQMPQQGISPEIEALIMQMILENQGQDGGMGAGGLAGGMAGAPQGMNPPGQAAGMVGGAGGTFPPRGY